MRREVPSSGGDVGRRRVLSLVGVVSGGLLAGCTGGRRTPASDSSESPTETSTPMPTSTTAKRTSERPSLAGVIGRNAVPMNLSSPSSRLDDVAVELASSSVVGIGENSHGVAEFKRIPSLLVERLVEDHGYRLLAIEATLGDFAPVNSYLMGETNDLDSALSSTEFYFWRADGIERLFERLREFNDGRPADDRVEVRGYDAQFTSVNGTAIREYLNRVDSDYLATIDDSLTPLTKPLHNRSGASYLTDSRVDFLEELRTRLRTHESAYVAESSQARWRLARRHVWTLERGLQFLEELSAENYTRGKTIRDRTMAENVAWLREWTGSDRAVVLGNANHTMRGYGEDGQRAARMGQHLSDELGSDYYTLGMTFGTGRFAAPGDGHGEFSVHDIDGPTDGTLAATLVDVDEPALFLDFETAREHPRIEDWLTDTRSIQFTVPRAASRGAVALPEAPRDVYDGVAFVRTVTPASFLGD